MKESPVDTLRNSFLLCDTLRNNWASGLLKERILLDENFSGDDLGHQALPRARASASTVAVVCDSKNEEVPRTPDFSEPTPATLRLWDVVGTDSSKTSTDIHYQSSLLSCHSRNHTHFVLDDFVVLVGKMNQADMSSQSLLDMMVVSIQEQRILFTKEKTFDIRNFIQGFEKELKLKLFCLFTIHTL